MWYRIISYLKFLLKSKNKHGVHSPFVFDLVVNCFYNKTYYKDYKKLEDYRNKLLSNNSIIEVTDLGAGSQKMKTNHRSIHTIAKNSGTIFNRAKLLYRISNHLKPKTVLELGTSLGIGTQALALGNSKSNITTIEGCSNIFEFTSEQLNAQSIKNITPLNGNFNKLLPQLSKNNYDLIFFDGNHKKEATLNYFQTLLTTVHNDTLFIFDDIYWSKGMTEAWETIKQHPKVTVTIDTYFWGFVFFRKDQAKEHFTIRL